MSICGDDSGQLVYCLVAPTVRHLVARSVEQTAVPLVVSMVAQMAAQME